MRRFLLVLALVVAAGLMMPTGSILAAEKGESSSVADDWFTKPDEKAAVNDTVKAKSVQEDKKNNDETDRYQYLLSDSGFDYYLDKKSAHWIPLPHSGSEYIADVWVRLASSEGAEKYYLEHYYVRPSTRQIQFLSELEVTGRPDNAIQERSYSAQHWENLVPGSIEEDIFNGVIKNMKKNKIAGSGANGMSIRDMAEEFLRISL